MLSKLVWPDSVTILEYHHCCSSVPLSVWCYHAPCLFQSRSQGRSTTVKKSASIFPSFDTRFNRILTTFFCIVAFSPQKTCHEFLNLFEDTFRLESWEDFLLEIPSACHRRDSIPWDSGATFRSTVISFQSLTPWQFQLQWWGSSARWWHNKWPQSPRSTRNPTDSDDAESDSEPGRHTAGAWDELQQREAGLQGFHERLTSLTENGKTGASHSNRSGVFSNTERNRFQSSTW